MCFSTVCITKDALCVKSIKLGHIPCVFKKKQLMKNVDSQEAQQPISLIQNRFLALMVAEKYADSIC